MLENFLPNDDFFRVYQNTIEGTLDYGIPYGILYQISGAQIKKNESIDIRFAWKKTELVSNSSYFIFGNRDTYKLPVGSFYTKFSQSFKVSWSFDRTQHDFVGETYNTDILHFIIKFTIR